MVQDRIYNYFTLNTKLHVLFVFDPMNIIETDLKDVHWAEGYIYHVFDGAWFNTKYDIENTWKDKNVILLFRKESYPQTEDQQLNFPLLDMLKANMEYREESYAAFIQQYSLPEKFSPFISRHISELTSSKISSMLIGYFTKELFSEDVAIRGFITSYLGEKKLMEWDTIIARMLILGLDSETKQRNVFFTRMEKSKDVSAAIDNRLNKIFGCTYTRNSPIKMKEVAECLKYNTITQLLSPAPADTYKKYKVTDTIMLDQINKIYETGIHDRQLSTKFTAAITELASDIREEEIIRVYGIGAQYYYTTNTLCWPILKELLQNKLLSDPDQVNEKMRGLSLKLPTDSDIQTVIRFISQLALYYSHTRTLGTLKLNTPDEYTTKYLTTFYLADTFYRHSLEAYHELISRDIPIEHSLNEAKNRLDQDYAKLTNILNLEWLTCVTERKDTFDSITLKHQEDFFKNEYDSDTKQVIIISDALRYEVAEELMKELAKEKHIAKITAYRSMLPTETKYCKPSLLPHQTLTLQGSEMLTDGQPLTTIEEKTAHLSRYKGHAVCISYEEVMNGDAKVNRELFKRPLVYIFHDTIDSASHSQSPFEVITACSKAIQQLAVLIRKLHASWNVTSVIVTADHGFIYNDMHFEEKDKHSISEEVIEKKTRYYLTTRKDPVEGIVKFPLQKVSGIISAAPVYVAVPIGTNRLAAPGGYNFAHGGATLQEMIIPVIHSYQRRTDKTQKVGVALMNHNLTMVSSLLKVQIIQSEAVTMTMMGRTITCCIYNGDEAVTKIKEINLNSTDSDNLNNRLYELTLTLSKPVSSGMLQLRICDKEDPLNPLIRETVKNSTIIEQDF